ncbi:HNH endonuclease signature motif containing protein [Corynebacterium kefirresidentii]|uniref:HNH endonuclease signature motif containing protein n=1 Tax=Corynebacterium kefirresidentii TaxID=1979527 RepID=A0ABT8Q4H3_9CORY|nr:HNH endonuclease signature motif containing protein [Corynebacterium kefirresidentii]MDN8620255.1 HNH endonuclease signature motif containing protein [Corynebacterium kefirresidentii]MDN8640769.1 HNH endonuclease signature motif containing protein [Corynebacterium kefirresidentii]
MEAYYIVNDPKDPLAVKATEIRKQDYLFWKDAKPDLEDDFDITCHTLATRTGLSERRTRDITMALYRLAELPLTMALQETYYFLDFSRLITTDAVLSKLGDVPAETLERIDQELSRYLTPSKPRQVLPSNTNLRRKLNGLIAIENPSTEENKEAPTKNNSYFTYSSFSGKAGLAVEFDEATLIAIDEHISKAAEEHGLSKAEALAKLILGEIESRTKVVLHMYRAHDQESAPAFIRGFGWVSPETADNLRPAQTRDMDLAKEMESESYVTPPLIGAYVEGRDGVCRWPGCYRPAESCQKDHRIDHARGGKTAGSNLASLCQHHHNVKTDGGAFYIMDPHTGDIVWLFDDGRWEYDEPQGPLTPKNKNWALTVDQAIAARRAAAKERNES